MTFAHQHPLKFGFGAVAVVAYLGGQAADASGAPALHVCNPADSMCQVPVPAGPHLPEAPPSVVLGGVTVTYDAAKTVLEWPGGDRSTIVSPGADMQLRVSETATSLFGGAFRILLSDGYGHDMLEQGVCVVA